MLTCFHQETDSRSQESYYNDMHISKYAIYGDLYLLFRLQVVEHVVGEVLEVGSYK